MIINFLVLAIAFVAAYFVVKEEKRSFQNWLYSDRTSNKQAIMKAMDFWGDVFNKRIRLVCVIAILIMQRSVISMFLSVIIFFAITYYLAKNGILDGIDWSSEKVQKVVTAITLALVALRIVDRVGLLKALSWIVAAVTGVIVVIVIIYLLVDTVKKKK